MKTCFAYISPKKCVLCASLTVMPVLTLFPNKCVSMHLMMPMRRLLSACALDEDYYDLVDVDSFGSETSFLGAAIETVK